MFFLLSQLKKDFKTDEQRHASIMLWEIQEKRTWGKGKRNDSVSKALSTHPSSKSSAAYRRKSNQTRTAFGGESFLPPCKEQRGNGSILGQQLWKSFDIGGVNKYSVKPRVGFSVGGAAFLFLFFKNPWPLNKMSILFYCTVSLYIFLPSGGFANRKWPRITAG